MNTELIYIGDNLSYELSLGKISALNGITYALTSTQEDFSGNLELLYSRVSIKFRLRFDSNYYSDWYDLSDFEFTTDKFFEDIYVNPASLTDLEVKFTLLSTPEVWNEETDNIEIATVEADTVTVEEVSKEITASTTPSAIGNDHSFEYVQKGLYNPYDLGAAAKLQDDLSFQAVEIYGHSVEYVKVREKTKKGTDFLLREFNLYGVASADVECLKVLVPDNAFPDNTFSFNPYGLDYAEMLEIHIPDSYFKKFFNKNSIPQQFDFLYFPLVNRMYEVSSARIVRNFNMEPNYWKLILSKYEKRANIILDDELKDKLDDKLKGLDSFQEEIDKETGNTVNAKQLDLYDDDLDYIRRFLNPNMLYSEKEIISYYTLISNSQYNLGSIWKPFVEPVLAVEYKSKFIAESTGATTVTFIAELDKVRTSSLNATMTLFSGNSYTVELPTGNYHQDYEVGKNISLWSKEGRGKVFLGSAVITAINNDRDAVTCIPNHAFTYENVDLVSLSNEREFMITGTNLYNMDTRVRSFIKDSNSERFRIYMIENNSIGIEYFGNNYFFIFENALSNENWYGFIFSFNLRFKQFALSTYEILANNASPIFDLVQKFTIANFESASKTSTGTLNLLSSPIKMTNIRVFKDSLEDDLHSSYLSKNIIDNGGSVIVVDNALRNLELEDYSIKEKNL